VSRGWWGKHLTSRASTATRRMVFSGEHLAPTEFIRMVLKSTRENFFTHVRIPLQALHDPI
jgi:hypothetical protein